MKLGRVGQTALVRRGFAHHIRCGECGQYIHLAEKDNLGYVCSKCRDPGPPQYCDHGTGSWHGKGDSSPSFENVVRVLEE